MKKHGAEAGGAAKKGGAGNGGAESEAEGQSQVGAGAKGGAALSDRLASLTSGLTFMSESDYPVEPFVRGAGEGAPSAEEFASGRKGDDASVRELDFERFFGNATREQDWQDEAARATVRRFQALVGFLRENLSDIKVYRVGGVDADVYVVGRTKSGDFAGVKTRVVET